MSDNRNYILYVRIDSGERSPARCVTEGMKLGDGFSGWKQEERRELVKRKIANKCCGAERWKLKENK
jgi:hypothetical protein